MGRRFLGLGPGRVSKLSDVTSNAPCLCRDSAVGSRLTEHQVCKGAPLDPIPLGTHKEGRNFKLFLFMVGGDRKDRHFISCQCYWQVAEPPEDWTALIWQQQRELTELWHNQEELLQRLCAQLEGLQNTVTDHVERALETRHEQERILGGSDTAGQ